MKRVALFAAAVLLLMSADALPAAADAGFSSNDFQARHAVADIGATAHVRVDGWMDRDLYASQPLFNVHPSFDLQQSCQNLVTPTDTIVATRTMPSVIDV